MIWSCLLVCFCYFFCLCVCLLLFFLFYFSFLFNLFCTVLCSCICCFCFQFESETGKDERKLCHISKWNVYFDFWFVWSGLTSIKFLFRIEVSCKYSAFIKFKLLLRQVRGNLSMDEIILNHLSYQLVKHFPCWCCLRDGHYDHFNFLIIRYD